MSSRSSCQERSCRLATAGGFGALLLWSTTIALARSLSEQVGPATAAAAVFAVSSVGALVALLGRGGKRRNILQLPAAYLIVCGALFTGYMLLLFLAVGRADGRQQVLEIGLINYLWPVLTLLLSLPLLKKRATWVLIPATLLALAGLLMVVTHGESLSWKVAENPFAYALAFGAALSWALYSNLTRRWAGGRNEGAVILFLPITALALILICLFLDEPREWSGRALAEALFLGAATYVAYALWDNAMRRGNIVLVAAASYLIPLVSTLLSCLYLAVAPGARLWVGCVVLILGSALSWLSVKEQGRKKPVQV
jgi:drug/metabolite transporter (DMT)-like permease